tara:strand:+ start:5828 stop:6025 length:198 start_codon:yes stop_codon:yes gene_type:complete
MSELNTQLHVRTNSDSLSAFKDRCKSMNRQYQDVLREMIEAFADDRLSIVPTNINQKDSYYVNRK